MKQFNHFGRFTDEAKNALLVAQEEARKSLSGMVSTEHILIGILSEEDSLGSSVLLNFGVSLDNVRLVLKSFPRKKGNPLDSKNPGISKFGKEIIELAVTAAQNFKHNFIGTEHLLFAICSQSSTAAVTILENMKVSPADIKAQILEIFERAKKITGNSKHPDKASDLNVVDSSNVSQNNPNPLEFLLSGLQGVMSGKSSDFSKNEDGAVNSATPALDYFTVDMVELAKKHEFDVVIGRENEIERIISILSRKTKNNPVLIGESGVGKTAVCEGLAIAIATGRVPENMIDKKVLSLSMSSVVAGTKYRGEFEERIKQIIEEAIDQPNVILFIDEFHTIMGAGSAEGSLDAANILKPALSRGKMQIVGATTTIEYRKHIEKDTALERRLQPVVVSEPTPDMAVAILEGIRESFEDHHNLIIDDSAILAAVKLSKRYINDRFLPDKAIDLMDEACAKKRIRTRSKNEKLRKLQKKLDSIIAKKEKCVSKQMYEKAAELRTEELMLAKEIENKKFVRIPRSKRKKITDENIADVVSLMTGVPVTRLVKDDISKLNSLAATLKKNIIGQDEAIDAVSRSIRRSRAGFSDEHRPIGSFIFMGPTGVGKTELVKTLAREVFNDENALIKIDMSEFMERHNSSRLVGASAGYIGYEEGGQLTEAVRRKPYSIVLFDEIEKAHPDVFNLLLQILEDGELTDAKGRKVDFKNTIIVLTSNIGAKKLTDKAAPIGFSTTSSEQDRAAKDFENIKKDILTDLKDHFRPEFLNRIDKVVVFKALTRKSILKIVKLHIEKLKARLVSKDISLSVTDGALSVLADNGFDPKYGARPVRRAIQNYVEDQLTTLFLSGEVSSGDSVVLTKNKDNVLLVKK